MKKSFATACGGLLIVALATGFRAASVNHVPVVCQKSARFCDLR